MNVATLLHWPLWINIKIESRVPIAISLTWFQLSKNATVNANSRETKQGVTFQFLFAKYSTALVLQIHTRHSTFWNRPRFSDYDADDTALILTHNDYEYDTYLLEEYIKLIMKWLDKILIFVDHEKIF